MNSNKLVRFLCIFIYTLILIIIVLQFEYYREFLKLNSLFINNNVRLSYFLFYAVSPFAIGILIVLPSFINKVREPGNWTADWVKLLAIGLPALYIVLHPLTLPTTVGRYIYSHRFPVYYENVPIVIGGLVLGYLTLSVFSKKE